MRKCGNMPPMTLECLISVPQVATGVSRSGRFLPIALQHSFTAERISPKGSERQKSRPFLVSRNLIVERPLCSVISTGRGFRLE